MFRGIPTLVAEPFPQSGCVGGCPQMYKLLRRRKKMGVVLKVDRMKYSISSCKALEKIQNCSKVAA